MSDTPEPTAKGDGYAVANLSDMGEGYGFRKVRKVLGVNAFGVNAIVLPPVLRDRAPPAREAGGALLPATAARIEIEFDEGGAHELEPGGFAWVDAPTVRKVRNLSDSEEAVYVVVGGKDGYVGRDGALPEDEQSRFGDDAPPGA